MPNLSIVIPTLNEERYLPRLLNSLAKQAHSKDIEVIIVDGKSEDNTVTIARSYTDKLPGLQVVRSERGISLQRNVGANKARSNQLVFLDADCEVPKGSLQKILNTYSSNKDFIAVPYLTPYDGKLIDKVFAPLSYAYFSLVSHSHPIIVGMCIITTKTAHDRTGGFNEKLQYAEDIDYGFRAVQKGAKYRILYRLPIKSSARRLNKFGRIKIGLQWLRWHRQIIKNGAPTTSNTATYEFGKFK